MQPKSRSGTWHTDGGWKIPKVWVEMPTPPVSGKESKWRLKSITEAPFARGRFRFAPSYMIRCEPPRVQRPMRKQRAERWLPTSESKIRRKAQ